MAVTLNEPSGFSVAVRAGACRRRTGGEHEAARVGVVRQHARPRGAEHPGHVAGVGVGVRAVGAPPFAPTFSVTIALPAAPPLPLYVKVSVPKKAGVRGVGEGPARVEHQRTVARPAHQRHARDGDVVRGHVAAHGGVEGDAEGVGIGLRDDRGGQRARRARDTGGAARAGRVALQRVDADPRTSRSGIGGRRRWFTSRKPCMPPSGWLSVLRASPRSNTG